MVLFWYWNSWDKVHDPYVLPIDKYIKKIDIKKYKV